MWSRPLPIVEHMWNPPLVINKWINKYSNRYKCSKQYDAITVRSENPEDNYIIRIHVVWFLKNWINFRIFRKILVIFKMIYPTESLKKTGLYSCVSQPVFFYPVPGFHFFAKEGMQVEIIIFDKIQTNSLEYLEVFFNWYKKIQEYQKSIFFNRLSAKPTKR